MVRVVFEIVFGLLCLALRVFRVVRVVWAAVHPSDVLFPPCVLMMSHAR